MTTSYAVAYALGWAAGGLLAVTAYAYLSREVCILHNCNAPFDEEDDLNDLDAISGVSGVSGAAGGVNGSSQYLKGSARGLEFDQVYGPTRLPRYDMKAGTMQHYAVPLSRNDEWL